MYTLRKILSNGSQINEAIGERYVVIIEGGKGQERFNQELKLWKETKDSLITPDQPRIFGFITTEKSKIIPLYVDEYIYIMTENGNTFSKLQ